MTFSMSERGKSTKIRIEDDEPMEKQKSALEEKEEKQAEKDAKQKMVMNLFKSRRI